MRSTLIPARRAASVAADGVDVAAKLGAFGQKGEADQQDDQQDADEGHAAILVGDVDHAPRPTRHQKICEHDQTSGVVETPGLRRDRQP